MRTTTKNQKNVNFLEKKESASLQVKSWLCLLPNIGVVLELPDYSCIDKQWR